MHRTPALHGIKGAIPFLKKRAPTCFSAVRIADLSHARIAIDATLLTQRLFYRDSDDEQRHLSGFLEVVRALRAHACAPILVFDHLDARLPQKAREQARRRAATAQAKERWEHEAARHARLERLAATLAGYGAAPALGEDAGALEEATASALRALSAEHRAALGGAATKAQHALDMTEAYVYGACWNASASDAAAPLWSDVAPHVAVLEALVAPAVPKAAVAAARAPRAVSPVPPPLRQLVALLVRAAAHLARGYKRTSTTVPRHMYVEAVELATRLNVPVLVTGDGTDGAVHEAEAYASALVVHGYADLVASEDSDVLLYGAPLLRGLPGTQLELVHTPRLPSTLFPRLAADDARARLVEFALLCGTDFNRTVPGIAVTRALAWMGDYGTVEALLDGEAKYAPPDQLSRAEYTAELDAARAIFAQPPPVTEAAARAGLVVASGGGAPHGGRPRPRWRALLDASLSSDPPGPPGPPGPSPLDTPT